MATFRFELVSPERLVFSGEVEHVVVPGAEGDFGILANHAPFVASLRPGVLSILGPGQPRRLFVRGGLAEAGAQGLTVLAEMAVPMEDLSRDAIAAEIKAAEEDVADARDDVVRARAAEKLDQLKQVQSALA